jgi:D,D-heptose 1,7-bisphosphate phosphatase
MANKAVFLDRDNTIIEDPGYLSDPEAVRLLPGSELALKSLAQAGYKLVVVTNQSGVARGLLTPDALDQIHAEMRRRLSEKGAHLDAIYYCPYHPEGTVEEYARESDLRKPRPGMLLRAAEDLDIDLRQSWMIGDGPRDIEAGHRAGCRTVRVRVRGAQPVGEGAAEDVQADYTVRNLVDAARVVLRESLQPPRGARDDGQRGAPDVPERIGATPAAVRAGRRPPRAEPGATADADLESMDRTALLREIVRYVRQSVRGKSAEEFSLWRVAGGVLQVLAIVTLVMVLYRVIGGHPPVQTLIWAVVAGVLQLMALTFFLIRRGG